MTETLSLGSSRHRLGCATDTMATAKHAGINNYASVILNTIGLSTHGLKLSDKTDTFSKLPVII